MFVGIMLVFVREVVGRYVFNNPFAYTQDITTMLMLFAMFWGAGYVLSVGGFPSVDIFYSRFSPTMKKFMNVLNYIAGLVFLLLLFWQVMDFFETAWTLGHKSTSIARIPLVIPYSVMLVGMFFFIVEICRKLVLNSILLKRHLKENH
ncbi:TRAP transporter small permease subunit [Chloroflexota bacterium]